DVELAERDAGGDDVLEALLVVVAHGDKLVPPRVAEPRPLMEEDRGVRQLASDYAQVSLYERAKPAAGAAAGRSGVGRFHEGSGGTVDDGPEQVVLGAEVGVEAAAAKVDALGQVAHAGPVVAALAEQLAGGRDDLVATGRLHGRE